MLGALGSLIGGEAGKGGQRSHMTPVWGVALQSRDERSRTVSCSIQIWKGLHLDLYKCGQGVITKKKNVEKTLRMPAGVSTNIQLDQLARRMHVPYFINVFIRNAVLISGARWNESGTVNLDDARGSGTHWVAYAKRDNHVIYFDSFGNLRPLKELCDISERCDKNSQLKSTIEHPIKPIIRASVDNCVCNFSERLMCTNLKPDNALFNSVFIRRFFKHVANTYATGKSNSLATIYFSAIDLSDDDYELGLINFKTYNTISNVNASNNKFYFDENDVEITLPEGSYEWEGPVNTHPDSTHPLTSPSA